MLEDDLEIRLAELGRCGLLRSRPARGVHGRGPSVPGDAWIDASSNDYLGLASAVVSRETLEALAALPSGSGASRLIHGTRPAHELLEAELAEWTFHPVALLFSSGYAANLGVISALADAETLIVSDELNHASLIDGCRLSRGRIVVTPHCDIDAVRAALRTRREPRALVLTESLFSMDGDAAPLSQLRELCNTENAALVVDEAHALGVLGPAGSGLCRQEGVQPDALIGTLGKAIGVQGAFVAGSSALCDWLWNRARSFVFSTAPSPWLAQLTRSQLARVRRADAVRAGLLETARTVEAGLLSRGATLAPNLCGPILPVLLGDNDRAVRAAERLREVAILTQAIRPPTVPQGTARLRLTVTANLALADTPRLIEAVADACRAR